MTQDFAYIKSISTWNSGGDIEINVIELKDGRVLGITEEVVILYKDMEDLEEGDPSEKRPTIIL